MPNTISVVISMFSSALPSFLSLLYILVGVAASLNHTEKEVGIKHQVFFSFEWQTLLWPGRLHHDEMGIFFGNK